MRMLRATARAATARYQGAKSQAEMLVIQLQRATGALASPPG